MAGVRNEFVTACVILLISSEAVALPFTSLDPRANAMGGAGVAASSNSNAAFVNPALLMLGKQPDVPVNTLPVSGLWRTSDPRTMRDEISHYQNDELEAKFETALANYKDDPSTEANRTALGEAVRNLRAQLHRFSGRATEEEVSVGLAVNLPERRMALLVDQQTIGGGRVMGVAEDVSAYEGLIDAMNAGKEVTDPAFNIVVSGDGRNINTKFNVRGATIREVGLAISREVQIGGHKLMAGVAPKYQDVTTFDYVDEISAASYRTGSGLSHHSAVNLDLGIAREYDSGWRGGAVLKNLIPYNFNTRQAGGRVPIQPQLRAGVAYKSDWYALAMDLDLTESRPVGFESGKQYLALGGEMDVTPSLHLRAGYRLNLRDNNASALTVGSGYSLWGAVTDVALSLNKDEIGLSAQMVFRY